MITAFLLIAAVQAAPSDRLEPLTLTDDRACTADGAWCVGLVQDEEPVVRPIVRAAGALPPGLEASDGAVETFQPWVRLARLPDGGFLAGVEVGLSSMYSGGGGQATELRLYRLNARGDAGTMPVLAVPIGAELMIRACFSEEDMKQRAGACHDEYGFDATLTAAGDAGDMPVFDYVTTATAYPRGASRLEDSLEKPPLKPADLVTVRDPKCSFSRRFTFDAVAGEYRPDSALPDCSDYTVP
ncbi:hypothetical protein EGY25_02765 [Brevundimonas intermedia]|uniref:Uncharacterized protein n=1 Tax=Brevundimonas intermedia TaxID=74315 RepID=A0A4Y9RXY6_9CAUL|nr:hypothetical protein [Brevundimonas intermedia]TFW14147.1 hypothetical protein EGY25_02765 [Brevundimonas intermedia]